MAAELTRLTHKITIQFNLVAESCTICSSRSRWAVRKLLGTPSFKSVYSGDSYHNLYSEVNFTILLHSHFNGVESRNTNVEYKIYDDQTERKWGSAETRSLLRKWTSLTQVHKH